jgi:hypothetical protein
LRRGIFTGRISDDELDTRTGRFKRQYLDRPGVNVAMLVQYFTLFWLGFSVIEVVGLVVGDIVGDIVTNNQLDLPKTDARVSYSEVSSQEDCIGRCEKSWEYPERGRLESFASFEVRYSIEELRFNANIQHFWTLRSVLFMWFQTLFMMLEIIFSVFKNVSLGR